MAGQNAESHITSEEINNNYIFFLEMCVSLVICSVLYCDLLEELICFLGQMSDDFSCAKKRNYFSGPKHF